MPAQLRDSACVQARSDSRVPASGTNAIRARSDQRAMMREAQYQAAGASSRPRNDRAHALRVSDGHKSISAGVLGFRSQLFHTQQLSSAGHYREGTHTPTDSDYCPHLAGGIPCVLLRHRRIRHIHVHHGYFSSWVGMVGAKLLGASFSMTLHGSDLLVRANFLDIKIQHCKFCITISDFNRDYILKNYGE